MSVFMMLQVQGDAKRVQAVMEANGEMFETINARAKANGAIHHRFLSSADGSTIAVFDEWESADGFNTFFNSSPEIPQMMAEAGVTTQPQISFWHPVDTPDAF
jgi:heme-degrading monooxygenase HmoA